MGAVFALFGGYYHWIEIIIGYPYSDLFGKIHFWTFFWGVNITFFPMHFLGLAGMPRRIPDYPDAFSAWNWIASMGSLFTFFSVLFFLFSVYIHFSNTNFQFKLKINKQDQKIILS
jgi:cytochrome c oxidase subunit 1